MTTPNAPQTLAPCPDCGCNRQVDADRAIECDSCGYRGPTADTQAARVEAWNRGKAQEEQRQTA